MSAVTDVASMDSATLERHLAQKTMRGAVVNLTSGGRVHSFYWLRRGKRLAVKVHPRPRHAQLPVVEALAAKLREVWSCPECGKVFQRRGKQKFCTPVHAAKFRKARWVRAQERKQRIDTKRDEILRQLR